MRARNKFLSTSLLGSTLFLVPSLVFSGDVTVTTDKIDVAAKTSNTVSLGGVNVPPLNGNIIIDGGTITESSNFANGLWMDSDTNTLTVIDRPQTVIPTILASGTSNSAIFVTATSGAGLITIGVNNTIQSDNRHAILFAGGTNHAGVINSGILKTVGVGSTAIYVLNSTKNGAIINNSTGRIESKGAGSLGIFVQATSEQDITNSGLIDATIGIRVSGDMTGTIINKNGGQILGTDAAISLSNVGKVSGGIINESGGIITGVGSVIDIQNGLFATITNSGSINGPIKLGDGIFNNQPGGTIFGPITGNTNNIVNINAGTGTFNSGGTIDKIDTINLSGGTVNINHVIGSVTPGALISINSGNVNLGVDIAASDVNNNATGNLSLSQSINLNGNYNQSTGSLTVKLIDVGNFGRLNVSGDLNMTNGGKIIVDVPTNTSQNILSNDTFDVVTVGGAVISDAATLQYTGTPLLSFTKSVAPNGKDIRLTAVRSIPVVLQSVTQTKNYGNLNSTLTGLMNDLNIDSNLRRLLNELEALGTADEINTAVRTLSSDNSRGRPETVNTTNTRINALLNNRLNVIRIASVQESDLSGYTAGSSQFDNGAWVQSFGMFANQRLREGFPGYNADTYGSIVGFDKNVSPSLVVGVAGTVASSKISTKDRTNNRSRVRNYQGTLYGTLSVGESYFDVLASIAHVQYKTVRFVTVGALNLKPLGRFDGKLYATRLAYNRLVSMGDYKLTPSTFINYSYSGQDAYTETNASTVGLQVDKQGVNVFEAGLGATLAYDVTTRHGGIAPWIELQVRHDFVADKVITTSSFIGGGSPFTIRGASTARTSVDMGAGFKVIIRENLNLLANYTHALKNTYYAHEGSLTLRYVF